MTAFVAWLALVGVALLWLFVFVVLAIAFRAWHKVAPQVTPLLAMFAPPAPASGTKIVPTTEELEKLEKLLGSSSPPSPGGELE